SPFQLVVKLTTRLYHPRLRCGQGPFVTFRTESVVEGPGSGLWPLTQVGEEGRASPSCFAPAAIYNPSITRRTRADRGGSAVGGHGAGPGFREAPPCLTPSPTRNFSGTTQRRTERSPSSNGSSPRRTAFSTRGTVASRVSK